MLTLLVAVAINHATVQVTPPSFAEALEPQIAIGRDHRIYVAYGIGNALYVSSSNDEGASYMPPVRIGEAGKLIIGHRSGPRITVHDGQVVVTATYATKGGGDLTAFRSADRGQTWTGPVQVNDANGSAGEGLHGMAVAPDGTIACAWLDLRGRGAQIYISTSKVGGAKWSENRLAYASPSGSVCECCHPTAAFDAKGRLLVMFRNSIGGARDMYIVSSPDLGRTFGPAKKLGEGTWKIDACPMDGGAIAFTRDGLPEAIWRREGTLYRSGAQGPERMLAEGRQGWIASGADGNYVTWSDGRRILAGTPSQPVTELSIAGKDSTVAASPDGKLVVAAWTENGIRAARLKYTVDYRGRVAFAQSWKVTQSTESVHGPNDSMATTGET